MKKQLLFSIFGIASLMGFQTANAQGADDAAVLEIVMNDVYPAGTTQRNVDIRFMNVGSNTINPLTFNWSSDGGATVNSYVVAFPLSSGFSSTITHTAKITFSNPGSFTEVMAWTSMPNGNTDSNTSNDTLRKQVFVNNGLTVNKNVFIEEFSTAPCGFCPDGAVVLENMLFSNPTYIAAALHAGFGTDAMTIPEHSIVASAFTNSAPAAAIDRVRWSGESNVAVGRGTWNSRANTQKAKNSPLDITVNGNVNATGTSATITVTANFVDFALPGDIRMGLYIVEDNVTGTGSGYNQRNYDNTTPGHPYQGQGDPIIGYVHRHVVRDVYPSGNPWGETGIIPNSPQPNTPYTKTYTVPLSSNWKNNDIKIVSFVGYYGSSVNDRLIINAEQVALGSLVTSIAKNSTLEESLKVYPNPVSDVSFIELKLKQASNVELRVFDITGKSLIYNNFGLKAAGTQLFETNTSSLNSGFYFVELTVGNKTMTKKIIVSK